MNFPKIFTFLLISTAMLFASCKKETGIEKLQAKKAQPNKEISGINLRKGFAALNKSDYVMTNYTSYAGALNYYDFDSGKFYPDIFKTVNGIDLGTTPSDIKIYGSKMYILTIEAIQVVNAKTCKLIKSITSSNLNMNCITFYKDKGYISNSLGVIEILDTALLEMQPGEGLGYGATGMVAVNDKLFAVGGEYFNFLTGKMVLPNRVFVITLNPYQTKKLIDFPDPYKITKDKYGQVYVTSSNALGIINSTTNNMVYFNANLKAATGLDPNSLVIVDNYALMHDAGRTKVRVFDIATKKVIKNSFISDGTVIRPDMLSVDDINKNVYIRDYTSGVIYVFDINGKKKRTLGNMAFGTGGSVFINR